MINTIYCSVEQMPENPNYPFTRGQLRYYLLRRHKNGLDQAVRKIGKRIFLNMALFDQWIESQKEGGSTWKK